MPRPNEPWIALEFGALETYASLIPEGEETPICLSFPSVFVFDENAKIGIPCESLADVKDEKAFVMNLDEVKMGKVVLVPGTDAALQSDSLLRALFLRIRSECARRYFSDRSISTCYILAHDQYGFFKALKSAASTAGFANVEFRNKAECVVHATIEEGKRYDNYVVLCDATYGLTSLSLLAPVGDGYSIPGYDKYVKRCFWGYEYVVEKTAKHILKAVENRSEKEEKKPLGLMLQIIAALQEEPDKDGCYRVRYESKKYKFTREQIERIEERYLGKLEKLFESFFDGIDKLTDGKPYEIVVVGAGSNAIALPKTLKKFAKRAVNISIEGTRNAAFDWVQVLRATENSSPDATSEKRQFVKTFINAQNSTDGKACLALAELFFRGRGTPCLREEAFYWTSQAASKGCVDALYRLGKCYEYGVGVKSDLARAIETYKRAALEGHPKAQYKLACRCADLGQDEQAKHWLELAYNQGYEKALEKFNKLNYKSETIANRINIVRSREKAKERRESVIGAFLSSLVFIIGAIYIPLTYTDGDAQIFAATLAALVLTGCGLAIVVVGSCLLLKYLRQVR